MAKKLSAITLKSLTEEDVGKTRFDGEGLYGKVRLQKSGIVAAFEYRFKLNGKSRSVSCGKWPTSSLKEIRQLRDEKRLLVESGIDPVEQNKSAKLQKQVEVAQEIERHNDELARIAAEQAAQRTFADALKQWKKLELVRRKDKGAEVIRAFQKDVFPTLEHVALIDIKRAMLLDIFDHVVERGSSVMACLPYSRTCRTD